MHKDKPVVEITNLKKNIKDLNLFKDINIKMLEGDKSCVLGLNGSGKSTLLRSIIGLDKCDEGNIKIMGYDCASQKKQALSYIGYMPQEVNLPHMSLVWDELITYAGYFGIDPQEAERRTALILEEISMYQFRDKLCIELSGGMKRRLMVARAMITRPKLLILDEPTAGVDVYHRDEMWHFIKGFLAMYNSSLLLVSHYQDECAALCDQVLYLNQGNLEINQDIRSLQKYFKQMATKRC